MNGVNYFKYLCFTIYAIIIYGHLGYNANFTLQVYVIKSFHSKGGPNFSIPLAEIQICTVMCKKKKKKPIQVGCSSVTHNPQIQA